ncbi:hypothetical protein MJO28_000528 [Puccinia striiformis f. sp. tritici]|uniref:serine C-palmitoyltransferase n=2 Tax=Puccinia striiformis TaxID=27350 RepID=A0A2S4V7J2_9BASI|nr:hypothetical protein MJO28_000528 [Puccinia striiformis f. sp. tritici]POW05499.1 hypothetical protein PSHT_10784 [Puccinia striiformis]
MDSDDEHSSIGGDQSFTPPLTYSEHSSRSSEKDEDNDDLPSTPFSATTRVHPPPELADHHHHPFQHHHPLIQPSKSATDLLSPIRLRSLSSDSQPPFSGVGWRIGTKQTDPNIFKDSNSLSVDPPRSQQLAHRLPARSFDSDPDFIPYPDDPNCLRHAEFGFDPNEQDFMWTSQFKQPSTVKSDKQDDLSAEDAGYFTYLTTYWSYVLVILIGHVRDAFGKRFSGQSHAHLKLHNGYAALNSDFDSFFTRRVKSRLDDCFGRPVTGTPARTITLLDRTSSDNCVSFKYTQTTTQALNISSYNYLGFAQSRGSCADAVEATISELGVSSSGVREDGLSPLIIETEKLLARFVGAEDAMLVSQGFATNSTTLPSLVGKGALVISDEYNHNSIRFGTRLSGAMVMTYKHNDMADLERLLREAISQGQPRRLRSWTKIVVVVEGIYSMEGSIVDLPSILRLKDKYKFYLYLDEAHSIGALGPNGRGACDYFGVDPSRVDLLMGTLTKSFGASGGYIAGNKRVIEHMRKTCHSSIYAETLSPPVISQILSAVKLIMVEPDSSSLDAPMPEGKRRLRRLAFNARYLRAGLGKLGFIVIGDRDSPVVPLLVYQPGKMLLFSRLMLQRYSIVVVIVGYPATPLVSGRVRFCVSAAHTKQDIDQILIATNEIGEALGMKFKKSDWDIQKVIDNPLQLVAESD